jgi:hypothetical protein
MSDLHNCPHCNCSLIDSEIPKASRCNESCDRAAGDYNSECWKNHHYGHNKYFFKTVGVEVSGLYDGVLYWLCPECNGTWHRWPEGSELYGKARAYLDSSGVLSKRRARV